MVIVIVFLSIIVLLCSDQVKVDVEEVRDVDACVPIPTKEVQLVG